MKITVIIVFLFFFICSAAVEAQSCNRREMLDVILKGYQPLKETIHYNSLPAINPALQDGTAKQRSTMAYNPVPRFQLPQGAIICRFEEYVQLHSPFKLNIGVGGE